MNETKITTNNWNEAHEDARQLCSIPGCGRRRAAHGLCATHDARQKAGKDLNAPILPYGSVTDSFRYSKLSHGKYLTSTYSTWEQMKSRCLNPNNKRFKDYGGRGITVCERWMRFENFLADMGERPSTEHSIDRFPDKNGNYEPNNCRWATRSEQQRNRRTNTILTHNGQSKTIQEWAEVTGIKASTISCRVIRGWSVSDALTIPTQGGSSKL